MFGEPVQLSNGFAMFNLVWTYAIKEVDGRKKALCMCDGSTQGGQVCVLDYTYANSPDHTCSHIFYALAAAENPHLYGANVSNAFAEAPPPCQGFTFARIKPSMHGGHNVSTTHPFHMAMSWFSSSRNLGSTTLYTTNNSCGRAQPRSLGGGSCSTTRRVLPHHPPVRRTC